MKNPLNLSALRRTISSLIGHQPIHVQQWVLLSGNGFTSENSWVYSWSWVGAIFPIGREVFRAFTTDGGTAAEKNFVIILPYGGVNGTTIPKPSNEIILYDMNGRAQGKYKINLVKSYTVDTANINADTIFKIELHVAQVQG